MYQIFLFYLFSFIIAFFLCIPIGPVNIEIFHVSLKRHYPQAISIAVGAGFGDALWAILAFLGISPFLKSKTAEGVFFIITAVITFVLGFIAMNDSKKIKKREEDLTKRIIIGKRISFIKGFLMVVINPLGIVSWMIILSFFRKMGVYIPLKFNYELFFYIIVVLGSTTYFLLIVFLTNKFKNFFNPSRSSNVIKYLGYILMSFSVYFIFYALKSFGLIFS